jgi:hypothetical protein
LYRILGYRNEALFGADVAAGRIRTLRVLPAQKKRAAWAARHKLKWQATTPGAENRLLLQSSFLDSRCEEYVERS